MRFVLLAVSVTSAVLIWSNYRHFQDHIAQDYANIIQVSAGEIELFMRYSRKSLESLAWVLAAGKGRVCDQKMALVAFNQINSEFMHVSLLSSKGHIIATTRLTGDKCIDDDPEIFKKASAGETVFSPIQFGKDRLPTLSLAVPFPRFDQVRSVVCGSLNLKHVWNVLKGITIGHTGHVYVMDVSGRYVAHRQIDQVLIANPQIEKAVLDEIRMGADSVTWFEKSAGRTFYCTGKYLPELDWVIALRQPTHEIYHFLYNSFVWSVLIVLAACFTAAGIGWYRIKTILKPIWTIHRQVERIGAGDLDQTVSVTSSDEIGDLAKAFNTMTANLKKMIGREIKTARQLAHAKDLAVLGASASKVTHEVGNLLNNLDLSTTTLKNENLSTCGQKALINVQKESTRVKAFIRDFLKFAKPPELKLQPVVLDLVIREAMAMHAPTAQKRKIKIQMQWPDKAPKVLADSGLIYQVFNNLIKNSIEAIDGSGRILVVAEVAEEHLMVRIEDDGTGMTPEQQKRLFEPFYTTKGDQGTGLGMAIVQSIVTAHRGTITCDSEPGRGTTMTVELPLV